MKISRRIDGSIRGAILSRRQSSLSSPPPVLPRLGGELRGANDGEAAGKGSSFYLSRSNGGALPRKALCGSSIPHGLRESEAKTLRPTVLSHPDPRTTTSHRNIPFLRPPISWASQNHAATAEAPQEPPPTTLQPPTYNKEECLSLVVYQPNALSVQVHLTYSEDPYMRGYALADGPSVMVSDRTEDMQSAAPSPVDLARKEERRIIDDLWRAMHVRNNNPQSKRLDDIYHIYQQLPEPRMRHLPDRVRHDLLFALGSPEKRSPASMLRYFAVVADVKSCGLPLRKTEWNLAIAYTARYVGWSTDVETESALGLWRQMEREAGIKGNEVTFNILFDVATKAGNFVLAEMIYKEMEARRYRYNRYHHVSLIHFFGLKRDPDGIRAAYNDMVEAGEMIDTVALNCVMAGLLRSGEETAAERVYERMKASFPEGKKLPQRTYATNKLITKALMMFAKVSRKDSSMRQQLQSGAPMAPDLQTYRLLINHYGAKIGDLSQVARYLDEMRFFQIELHGSIFLALFKSFAYHGGYRGAAWSEQRLDSIWKALLQALDEGATDLSIETWLAGWALKAFRKCSSEQRVMEVYGELEARWKLSPADSALMMDFLHKVLDGDTRANKTVYRG